MSNDNRKAETTFAEELFKMMADVNLKIVERPRSYGKPFVIDPIKRSKESQK